MEDELKKAKASAKFRSWYERNKEKKREASRQWRAQNKERKSLVDKEWKSSNRDRTRQHNSKRRALQRGAVPEWLTEAHLQAKSAFYEEAVRMESESGIYYHVDHIVPISNRGLDVPWNMQILEASENKRKKDSTTPEAIAMLWERTEIEFSIVMRSLGKTNDEILSDWFSYKDEFHKSFAESSN